MTFSCAECTKLSCRSASHEDMPKNCPILTHSDILEKTTAEYLKPEILKFYRNSILMEAEAFGRYPRLKETILFCKMMKYNHIGVAFCAGLADEAKIVGGLLRKAGFTVDSVCCKVGGTGKDYFGISKENWVRPKDSFEPACNPIGQARLLADQKTDFNIIMGLCVGHDSLFIKYSDALCTVLVVKDRVCGHNPAAAIYLHKRSYWGSLHSREEGKNEST